MKFFRLDSSLRTAGSVTRTLADIVERQWLQEPEAIIVRRDLGLDPLPEVFSAAFAALKTRPEGPHTQEEMTAAALVASLVDEFVDADAYLFAVPLYNWNVPHQVKLWIDLLLTDPRAGTSAPTLLPGRPAILVEARGGAYGPGQHRDGWDHATGYLRHVLGGHFGLDVVTAEADLTLADSYPALAQMRELARQQLAEAKATAARHATDVANRLRVEVLTDPRPGWPWPSERVRSTNEHSPEAPVKGRPS